MCFSVGNICTIHAISLSKSKLSYDSSSLIFGPLQKISASKSFVYDTLRLSALKSSAKLSLSGGHIMALSTPSTFSFFVCWAWPCIRFVPWDCLTVWRMSWRRLSASLGRELKDEGLQVGPVASGRWERCFAVSEMAVAKVSCSLVRSPVFFYFLNKVLAFYGLFEDSYLLVRARPLWFFWTFKSAIFYCWFIIS